MTRTEKRKIILRAELRLLRKIEDESWRQPLTEAYFFEAIEERREKLRRVRR